MDPGTAGHRLREGKDAWLGREPCEADGSGGEGESILWEVPEVGRNEVHVDEEDAVESLAYGIYECVRRASVVKAGLEGDPVQDVDLQQGADAPPGRPFVPHDFFGRGAFDEAEARARAEEDIRREMAKGNEAWVAMPGPVAYGPEGQLVRLKDDFYGKDEEERRRIAQESWAGRAAGRATVDALVKEVAEEQGLREDELAADPDEEEQARVEEELKARGFGECPECGCVQVEEEAKLGVEGWEALEREVAQEVQAEEAAAKVERQRAMDKWMMEFAEKEADRRGAPVEIRSYNPGGVPEEQWDDEDEDEEEGADKDTLEEDVEALRGELEDWNYGAARWDPHLDPEVVRRRRARAREVLVQTVEPKGGDAWKMAYRPPPPEEQARLDREFDLS